MMGLFKRVQREDGGSAVLEACIVVPLFLFFVLTLYGLITVFMAQNIIGHALLESTQSLALDAYATDKLSDPTTVQGRLRNFFMELTGSMADDPYFSDSERWYDRAGGATKDDWVEAAEKRFLGYLAGGDADQADGMLRALRVTDGVAGLDFSQSDLRGSDLCIQVSYQIEFFFNPFGLAEFSTTQQASARMWGASLKADSSASGESSPTGGASAGGSSGGGFR